MALDTVSVYTVVRKLLTEAPKLSTEQLIERAKQDGVKRTDAEIRKVVHWTRSDILKKKTKKATSAKPTGAAQKPGVFTLAREILTAEPELTNEAVFARIKTHGTTKSDSAVRDAIRNVRYDLHRKGAKPVPAAARLTAEPVVAPVAEVPETALFASIAQANKTAHLCGGIAKAREITESIRACGGIDAFLKRLDVVAAILSSDTDL